ncbi:hypothetical protein MCC93_13360 [Morococcus cerebrosus]|uniref:Uncharacterized protein n=1 Tax=Morococcus cerebrosus TaxID=1056807 RepID=A0A0C1EFX9_9NEIS|nr:hypothetical protein MCC93_13360 [Morococcus cerebrosus]
MVNCLINLNETKGRLKTKILFSDDLCVSKPFQYQSIQDSAQSFSVSL